MRNFKKSVLPVLCLVLILAGVTKLMNYALIPYSYVRIMMRQVTTEAYDTVFLGTSHGLNGIDPRIIQEDTGEKSINLCLGGEYPRDAYYFLKLVCQKGVPKRVVYELDAGYFCTREGQRGDFNRVYYEMPWSKVKLEYFADKMLELDFRAALFPWFYYRGQLKNVKKIIACKQGRDYREYGTEPFRIPGQSFSDGFLKNTPVTGEKQEGEIILWNEKEKNEDSFRYFERLVKFCQERSVKLMVVVTPVPRETLEKYRDGYRRMDAYFKSYLEKQGVAYRNYNDAGLKIKGFHYNLDGFVDYEGHMDQNQAEAFSRRLAQDLKGF